MSDLVSFISAVTVLLASMPVEADDLVFKKTKIVHSDGEDTKEIEVIVTWKDDHVEIVPVKKIRRELPAQGDAGMFTRRKSRKTVWVDAYPELNLRIPYDRMFNLSYEYSKHWRVVSAILISPWTLFSKRKHHWFSFAYETAGGKRDAIVFRIDKREQLSYRRRVPALTGLDLTEHTED